MRELLPPAMMNALTSCTTNFYHTQPTNVRLISKSPKKRFRIACVTIFAISTLEKAL